MTKDLREFINKVRAAGPPFYAEVKQPLDPVLEITAVQHKLAMEGYFPLLFCPKVIGSRLPLVTNLFGSYELLGVALDMEPESILSGGQPLVVNAFRQRQRSAIPTTTFKGAVAPVQEVVLKGESIDLNILPITKHAIGDSARYISSGITVTREPKSGHVNAGIYRLELKAKDRLGCRINPGSNGAVIAERYAKLGQLMEAVVIIGHHPLVSVAAGHLHPLGINEFEIAGGLLGEPVEMTNAVSVGLPVPAQAEIAIEGVIDPREQSTDGPVAEAMGFYGEARPCFVIHVTAITMRNDAIYHDLYPAHQEHFMVSILPRQIEVFDKVKATVPSLTALNYGPNHKPGKTIMYVSLKKECDDDARKVGEAILRADRWVTVVIVVDDDVNVYDDLDVMWAVATNVQGERNITNFPPIQNGPGLSSLPRLIIDATRSSRLSRKRVVPPAEISQRINLKEILSYSRKYAPVETVN